MTTAVVTTKGQIVIPSRIRMHLNIKKGAKLCVVEEGGRIILQPLTADYFDKMAGVLHAKGKLTRTLARERAREKQREDRS